MTSSEKRLPVWFFVGILLLINGLAVFGSGIYWFFVPAKVILANMHVGFWWGIVIIAAGLIFIIKNRPERT